MGQPRPGVCYSRVYFVGRVWLVFNFDLQKLIKKGGKMKDQVRIGHANGWYEVYEIGRRYVYVWVSKNLIPVLKGDISGWRLA